MCRSTWKPSFDALRTQSEHLALAESAAQTDYDGDPVPLVDGIMETRSTLLTVLGFRSTSSTWRPVRRDIAGRRDGPIVRVYKLASRHERVPHLWPALTPTPVPLPEPDLPAPSITVIAATRLREDRLAHLAALHTSLARQSVPWQCWGTSDRRPAGPAFAPGPTAWSL